MFSKRHSRRFLLIEFNPYQILAATISWSHRDVMVVESTAEFHREDTEGLQRWIETDDAGRKIRMKTIAGFVPRRGIVQRQSLQPARLTEPGYLAEVVQEHQKGRFLSATPFKIVQSRTWTLRTVSALDGTLLPSSGATRPALICGMITDEVNGLQQQLADYQLVPDRIEAGLFSLFGAVYGCMERRSDTRAVVVIVIHQSATAVYILGREGVHTPNPVLHGYDSIVELARKEYEGKEEAEVRRLLDDGDRTLVNHATKLVRRIARDLKPVVDSFEMTTGQPVEEIFCAYLPPNLNWLAEPLARVIGRTPFAPEASEWLPAAGLALSEGMPPLGPHWLGALSLAANLPESAGQKSERVAGEDRAYYRPWHVDCRPPADLRHRKLAGRRFLTGTIAASLLGLVVLITLWQIYATRSLQADTRYWEQQMEGNRKLFDDLTVSNATLKAQTNLLDRAYDLMGTPYQLSDLILNLGRTIPARMRVEKIETSDARVAISGSMLEPAEEASGSLGRYMDELRRNPAIGPLFSDIKITSLQRKTDSDAVTFEITLRLNRSNP